jgi:hypothetical protein
MDSSDDPILDRIFHTRWQHCGAAEPGGQGAISRSCASRSAGSAGGIGAAYLVATTIPSVRCSGSETRWEHKEVPAGFAIPRQEIARSDGAPMMTLPQTESAMLSRAPRACAPGSCIQDFMRQRTPTKLGGTRPRQCSSCRFVTGGGLGERKSGKAQCETDCKREDPHVASPSQPTKTPAGASCWDTGAGANTRSVEPWGFY